VPLRAVSSPPGATTAFTFTGEQQPDRSFALPMIATAVRPLWLAAGKRTPFAKAEGALAQHNAIALSVPVLRVMFAAGAGPILTVPYRGPAKAD